jgi:hypothetical protein
LSELGKFFDWVHMIFALGLKGGWYASTGG